MFSKGYNNIILTRDFMALMEENKNDVRNNLRIMHQDSITNNSKTAPRYYLNKYPGRIDNSPQDVRVNNIPVLRYSEVYLNGAEAALKSGNMAVAAELYNAIASRAISTTDAYTAKSTVTLEDILTERRKELVGEGHRFFDLMRNNLECVRFTESTDKGYHLSALRDPSIRFDNTYFRIILPLPKSECDANEVLRAQQNPGY